MTPTRHGAVPPLTPSIRRLYDDPREAGPPDQATLDWLKAHSVGWQAIALPWAIQTIRAVFDLETSSYQPCALGAAALLLPAIVGEVLVDVVAWCPSTSEIGNRFGLAPVLGEESIGLDGLGTTGLAIPIYPDPLAWLRADRVGVVVVNWEQAARRLAGVAIAPRGGGPGFIDELKRRLVVPPPVIVLSEGAGRRAAA